MSNFKQKNENIFLYAQNRLTHRLKLQLEQIKLKCTLLDDINDENESEKNNFQKKFQHKTMAKFLI